jgi:hypothetical protein
MADRDQNANVGAAGRRTVSDAIDNEFLSCWRWRAPCLAGRLWAGWIACAMVCGALRWRPHVLVAGGPGTGA